MWLDDDPGERGTPLLDDRYETEGADLRALHLWSRWREENKKRLKKQQVPITYGRFINNLAKQEEEEKKKDFRPDYAKPILDKYDPESDEYAQWKDTMDTWEREDVNRAKANELMNTLVQKYSGIIDEAKKEAEYNRLIENFSSNYKQNVDTSPLKRYHFI